MSNSILCKDEACIVCGQRHGLERHHVMFGNPRRQLAEEDGLWVWLCPEHHRGTYGVHGRDGHELDSVLKRYAQRIYEQTHSREEWMERYRRNYLDE